MSRDKKNFAYALGQEVPKIVYTFWINTVSTKKYTLLWSRVLQTEGGPDGKLGVRHTHHWVGKKLGQASFWNSKKWLHLFLCRLLLEFQNVAWPRLDQLNLGCGAPPTFPLVTLVFEYLALPQVYCILFFFCGDCKPVMGPNKMEDPWLLGNTFDMTSNLSVMSANVKSWW